MMKNLKTLLVFFFFSTLAMALSACMQQASPAVDFTNIKGEEITAQQLQGKVHLINFWATSCSTCVKEMPALIATYEKFHGQGLEFFAVAMSYDSPDYVLNFAETRALPFNVVLDLDGKIAEAFGEIKLTPTTLLISKQGKIVRRYVGEPNFEELRRTLRAELEKKV